MIIFAAALTLTHPRIEYTIRVTPGYVKDPIPVAKGSKTVKMPTLRSANKDSDLPSNFIDLRIPHG
jgi:hypothetical protein